VVEGGKWICDKCRSESLRLLEEKLQNALFKIDDLTMKNKALEQQLRFGTAGRNVTSGVPQGSVLRTLLPLVYVNDIWRNIDASIIFFADFRIIYCKFTNTTDIEELQNYLDTLREWAVGNGMKINPSKCKAIKFTKARVKNPLIHSLCDQKIPEASSCK
jgi:hypothetical protein